MLCKFKIFSVQIQNFSALAQGKVKSKTIIYGGQDAHDRSSFAVRTWRG
jgi:hypothetical protein